MTVYTPVCWYTIAYFGSLCMRAWWSLGPAGRVLCHMRDFSVEMYFCLHDAVSFYVQTPQVNQTIRWHLWIIAASVCREEDRRVRGNLVNRNPTENNDCPLCVCVCVNTHHCYCADPVCGHLPFLEKQKKKRWEEGQIGEIKMEGRRPLLHPLSLLLSKVYPKEREGSSCGPVEGWIEGIWKVIVGGQWRGVGREKQQQRGRCVCALGVFVALQLLGVCVCVDGLCPLFPGKGGSHQRGGQETLTELTSCSSPDGRPDSEWVCVCVRACAHVRFLHILLSTLLDVAHNSFCCFKHWEEFSGWGWWWDCGVDGTNLTLFTRSSWCFFIIKVNYLCFFGAPCHNLYCSSCVCDFPHIPQ